MTLLDEIRAADPLDAASLAAWSGSLPALPHLVPPRRRHHAVPLVAAVAALGAGSVGVAVARGVLGGPAPDAVKHHLAALDRGIPADLRYDPDVEHARTVAATTSGALYLADLPDGGYCLEVGSPSAQPRGASCVPAGRLPQLRLDVLAPIPAGDDAPLLVGGRANDPRITRVEVRYGDGSVSPVSFGTDHSWLLEVPEAQRKSVLSAGLVVVARDVGGAAVVTSQVPALRDDDPTGTANDATQPLVLTTTSDGNDLTLVLGIQGRVNLTGVRLAVRFPDGTQVPVPVADDGSFHLTFAADRWDDVAASPGEIIAIRGDSVVATQPFASVAYWRGHNGG